MGSSSKEETETQPVVAHRLPTTADSSPKASVFASTEPRQTNSLSRAFLRKDNVSTEKLIKIQIPATLRKQLTDDWENITQKDKIHVPEQSRRRPPAPDLPECPVAAPCKKRFLLEAPELKPVPESKEEMEFLIEHMTDLQEDENQIPNSIL
ncbi:hypothetical protein YC2023_042574 [Brassica napus]